MPHCSKCGTDVADNAAFCPSCGATQGTAVASASPATSTQTGMSENVAGLLCYLLGWLTGLIFLLIDKRPFVRFHAAQSIVVFGALFILRIILTFGLFGATWGFFTIWGLISLLVSLVTLVAWIVLMVMAYQGKMFEVPIAAGIAKSIGGRSK